MLKLAVACMVAFLSIGPCQTNHSPSSDQPITCYARLDSRPCVNRSDLGSWHSPRPLTKLVWELNSLFKNYPTTDFKKLVWELNSLAIESA